MNPSATRIIVPGDRPVPPMESGTPWPFWMVGVAAIAIVLVFLVRGRRRSIDPGELAFRRVATGLGLSRREIRAVRRAASAQGMDSPAAIAISPELFERAIRDHAQPRRRGSRPLAVG